MGTTPIRLQTVDVPAQPPRRRVGFTVSDDLYEWLRAQATAREQSLAAYTRGTLHAVKRQQEGRR